jgi:ParB family chromosome partitioning protein
MNVTVSSLSVTELEPNAGQPRRDFSPESLGELTQSIKTHGILQPLVVRPCPNGRYQIVAGERRWRAARMAGLTEVPVVVRELSDAEAYEVSLIENLSRADLNPIEEANGYKTLSEQFNMTQEQIAERVGRSRSAVANALRLLSLPPDALVFLQNNTLSAGHARALLSLPQEQIISAAERIIAEGLSVRQTEQLAKRLTAQNKAPPPQKPPVAPTFYREVELALTSALSRRIRVLAKGDGKGELTVTFYNADELTEFARRLAANSAAELGSPALPHEMKQRIGDDHA